jgi:hypothetical protein
MERYRLEHYGDAWYLVDTLQQRVLVEAETFAVCDQVLESLKGRLMARDEVTETEEVAAIIAANT